MNTEDDKPSAPVHAIVMRAGGPVVKDWGTHFLRSDTEIRKQAGCFEDQVEAYSLFCVEPYGRVQVFGGTKQWTIIEATKVVEAA